MDKVYRQDIAILQTDTSGPDPVSGFLRGAASIAKEGIYEYSDGVKSWKEYTPLSTLTDPKWLKSLQMSPITLDHPDVGLVTPKNSKQYTVGSIGSEIGSNDAYGMIGAEIKITDDEAIVAALTTHKQVSAGYLVTVKDEAGFWNGMPYDRIQMSRIANHVALVPEGRHGPMVKTSFDSIMKIRQDGAAIQVVDSSENELSKPVSETPNDTLHEDTQMKELELAIARADAADVKIAALEVANAALVSELEAVPAKLEAAIADAANATRARAKLEGEAVAILGAEFDSTGKSDREIKVAMLDAKGLKVTDDKSDLYVDAALDALATVTAPILKVGLTASEILAGGLTSIVGDAQISDSTKERAAWAKIVSDKANQYKN